MAVSQTQFDPDLQKLTTDVATLMKWAALDNDRTMLFGAEIHVRLGL